jgi:hypothetical protein
LRAEHRGGHVPLTGENGRSSPSGWAPSTPPDPGTPFRDPPSQMESLTAQDLAFTVIPRLNAAGIGTRAIGRLVAPDLSRRETAARLEGRTAPPRARAGV